MPQFAPEALQQNQVLLNLLDKLAARHVATPAQISLAWMINKRPYIVPIPGSRHLDRIKDNLAAAQIKMSAEEVAQIDQALAAVPISAVFGGTKIERKSSCRPAVQFCTDFLITAASRQVRGMPRF